MASRHISKIKARRGEFMEKYPPNCFRERYSRIFLSCWPSFRWQIVSGSCLCYNGVASCKLRHTRRKGRRVRASLFEDCLNISSRTFFDGLVSGISVTNNLNSVDLRLQLEDDSPLERILDTRELLSGSWFRVARELCLLFLECSTNKRSNREERVAANFWCNTWGSLYFLFFLLSSCLLFER